MRRIAKCVGSGSSICERPKGPANSSIRRPPKSKLTSNIKPSKAAPSACETSGTGAANGRIGIWPFGLSEWPVWGNCAALPQLGRCFDRCVVAMFAANASCRFVRTPAFQPAKMLHNARKSGSTGRTAASGGGRERQQWAETERLSQPIQKLSRCGASDC